MLGVSSAINGTTNTHYLSPLLISNSNTTNSGVGPHPNHVNMANSQANGILLSASSSSNSATLNITSNSAVASKSLLNNTTIKLVQRLLDEASQTGDLILSSKNLNEFPSKIANNYDLSDTITAGELLFVVIYFKSSQKQLLIKFTRQLKIGRF